MWLFLEYVFVLININIFNVDTYLIKKITFEISHQTSEADLTDLERVLVLIDEVIKSRQTHFKNLT